MSTSLLHVFAKDTDAVASIRGYNYQILKTLEVWLENLLNGIEEEIYCDYEEDIFHRSIISGSTKFRQLKLYSSNFSFKSNEIEKCISHFFMLHIKTDYMYVEKEFIFEANTNVAGNYKDNDVELLRKWVENQENLAGELLNECSDKVMTIVTKYVYEQAKELKDKVEEKVIQEAIKIFEALRKDEWLGFTRNIKWRFAGKEPDKEFSETISKIEALILRLPQNIDKDNLQAVFGILYKEVSLKASNVDPQKRKLTGSELELLLIDLGDKEAKWYVEVFGRWDEIKAIENFKIGEFYEVISATKYCRNHKYLSSHDWHWLNILQCFIDKLEIRKEFRKEAIYELLWLRFRPEKRFELPKGDFLGVENLVRFYFSNIDEFKSASSLEDAISLLQITFTAIVTKKAKIEFKEILKWFRSFFRALNKQLKATENPNEKCHLLEITGTLVMFTNQRNKNKKDPNDFLKYFENILDIIDAAPHYHASRLSDRLNQYIKIFTKLNAKANSELISSLQEFSEKFHAKVQERESQFTIGKKHIGWGANNIYTNDPEQILKALNHFHKAKDHWNNKESIEGHVLALLNISQLYSGIGLNFAAKYYALAGVWVSVNNGDKTLLKRIADSLSLVFHSDFKQGSWLSALSSFRLYLNARHEFDPNPPDFEKDDLTFKTIADFGSVLFAIPNLSPQFKVLIDSIIHQTGDFGKEIVIPFVESIKNKYHGDKIRTLFDNKLDDFPLNDSGNTRTVRFNALGSLWQVTFKNDYETNSIAEEFLAMLQIMLAEISLSKLDFHLIRGDIRLEIEITSEVLPPNQLPSNDKYSWKVYLDYFDKLEAKEINFHSAKNATSLMFVLDEISLLKDSEFKELFERFFKENSLSSKTLSTNSYQRMYRQIINKDDFESLQRKHFQPVILDWKLPLDNNVLKWKEGLSEKYNQEFAINCIKERFKNSYKFIHLTIEKLKQGEDFKNFVNELRNNGFLDWQIVMAMGNFVIDYKAQREIRESGKDYSNEKEYLEDMEKSFHKYSKMNEEDLYIEFPLEAFRTPEYEFQLRNYPVQVLKSFGLENKSRFPNFESIKNFLDVRFNMKNDNSNSDNPLL